MPPSRASAGLALTASHPDGWMLFAWVGNVGVQGGWHCRPHRLLGISPTTFPIPRSSGVTLSWAGVGESEGSVHPSRRGPAGTQTMGNVSAATGPTLLHPQLALAGTLPGETKKTLCRISFLVTSKISLVTLTSLPTVGGTRRKSRILEEGKALITSGGSAGGRMVAP